MKKDKGSNVKGIVIAVLLAGLVLFYFNYLSDRSARKRTEKVKTELENLMNYNMVDDYPKTPRDVVKLHNRYFKAFYGQSLTDDELVVMNQKVRFLYSKELLAYYNNSENEMLNALKKNIESMKKEKYTYRSYVLPEASQVITYTQDGRDMATLEVTVTLDTKDNPAYMYIQYILVKEDGKWKIYGWGDSALGESTIQ